MREQLTDLRSTRNPKARIKIMEGHFATVNSHINTYIDMSTVKCRHNNGRETARVLAEHFRNNTMVDTIVCLDGTEVIGTFMAEFLSDRGIMSINSGNNISIITPDVNAYGQLVFMDSTIRMINRADHCPGSGSGFLLWRDCRRCSCDFQQCGADTGRNGDFFYFSQRGSAGLSGLSAVRVPDVPQKAAA